MIIERNSQDYQAETKELFNKVKPFLDNGYSYNKAVKVIKNIESLNTKASWFKDLVEYGEKQGYSRMDFSTKQKYKRHKGWR